MFRVLGSPKHQHINPNFSHTSSSCQTVYRVVPPPPWGAVRAGSSYYSQHHPSHWAATGMCMIHIHWARLPTLFRCRSTRRKWEPVWTTASNQGASIFCHDWKGRTGHWESHWMRTSGSVCTYTCVYIRAHTLYFLPHPCCHASPPFRSEKKHAVWVVDISPKCLVRYP